METLFEVEIDATPELTASGRSQATILIDALTYFRDRKLKDLQEELLLYANQPAKEPTELFNFVESDYIRQLFREIEAVNSLLCLVTDGLETLLVQLYRNKGQNPPKRL